MLLGLSGCRSVSSVTNVTQPNHRHLKNQEQFAFPRLTQRVNVQTRSTHLLPHVCGEVMVIVVTIFNCKCGDETRNKEKKDKV